MSTPQEQEEGQSERNFIDEPLTEEGQSGTHRAGSVATSIPNSTDGDVDMSRLTSKVWLHMKKKRINGELKAFCNYCDAILAAESKSGTKHLHLHVQSCLNRKENEDTQGKYKFDQEESRRNLVEMIVLHEHPLSIVEQVGFKKFVDHLQPLFKVPSRSTLRRDVFKLYVDRMKETMALLDRNKGRVAITTDMWTADNQKKAYMAVTAHFVDDSWHLQQHLLRYIYLNYFNNTVF